MNSSFECEYKCSRLDKELGVIMPVKLRKGSFAVLPKRRHLLLFLFHEERRGKCHLTIL